MPANPKLFIHGKVYCCSFRTLFGLPLPPNEVVKELLKSVLAKAQTLYPVVIGDFCIMSNHLHVMILVLDPTLVDQFFRYLKTESAHAINRMTGRIRGPVWDEGYDSPPICDYSKYFEKAAYFLLNPQRAHLIERIENYPHLSSWKALVAEEGELSEECYDIRRYEVPVMPSGKVSKRDAQRLRKLMLRNARKRKKFVLRTSPRACFEAFAHEKLGSWKEHRERLVAEVKREEEILASIRFQEKKTVIGAQALRTQSVHAEHTPKKHGRKMICLAEDKELRFEFISWFRGLVKAYRVAVRNMRYLQRNEVLPFGFFPPGGLRPTVSILPSVCPF